MSEHKIQSFLQTQIKKFLCLVFFLQDQCLPTAAGALAEQVGSFDLFCLFACFVGWLVQFVVWRSRSVVLICLFCWFVLLVCSVRCLVKQVGFFDFVSMLLKSVMFIYNLKIFDLFIQRFVVEEQNQKAYLKYLDKRSD